MLGKFVKIDWVQGMRGFCLSFASSFSFIPPLPKQANKATNKWNQILTRYLWILELHDAPKMTYTILWG